MNAAELPVSFLSDQLRHMFPHTWDANQFQKWFGDPSRQPIWHWHLDHKVRGEAGPAIGQRLEDTGATGINASLQYSDSEVLEGPPVENVFHRRFFAVQTMVSRPGGRASPRTQNGHHRV